VGRSIESRIVSIQACLERAYPDGRELVRWYHPFFERHDPLTTWLLADETKNPKSFPHVPQMRDPRDGFDWREFARAADAERPSSWQKAFWTNTAHKADRSGVALSPHQPRLPTRKEAWGVTQYILASIPEEHIRYAVHLVSNDVNRISAELGGGPYAWLEALHLMVLADRANACRARLGPWDLPRIVLPEWGVVYNPRRQRRISAGEACRFHYAAQWTSCKRGRMSRLNRSFS
jgi:hypothetical protein